MPGSSSISRPQVRSAAISHHSVRWIEVTKLRLRAVVAASANARRAATDCCLEGARVEVRARLRQLVGMALGSVEVARSWKQTAKPAMIGARVDGDNAACSSARSFGVAACALLAALWESWLKKITPSAATPNRSPELEGGVEHSGGRASVLLADADQDDVDERWGHRPEAETEDCAANPVGAPRVAAGESRGRRARQ